MIEYHCKQKWAYPFDLREMHSPNKSVFFGKIMMLLLLEAAGENWKHGGFAGGKYCGTEYC